MPRWVRDGITAILAAVAVIVTVFPPPALPLRWLPAVSALILGAMLFWSRRERPAIPPQHADVLRGLGASVISDLNSKRPVQFPGTALECEQHDQAFRAHFPQYARKLRGWDALARSWNESLLAIHHTADEVSRGNGFESGGGPLYSVARAYVDGVNPTPVSLNDQPKPDKTTILLYGQNQIAVLDDPTARQVADRKEQFQNLLLDVHTWSEVKRAQSIRRQLETLSRLLSPQAQRIRMSHDLRVVSTCPICPKS
jgi:hypothetical protein